MKTNNETFCLSIYYECKSASLITMYLDIPSKVNKLYQLINLPDGPVGRTFVTP